MPTSIELGICKCGQRLKLQPRAEYMGDRPVLAVASICPKARWFNYWRHNRRATHAWLPK